MKLVPYTKHQCWENGENRSTYIHARHVGSLRQDLENGKRFQQITAQPANDAIQRSREQRLCAARPDGAPTAEKNLQTRCLAKKYRETEQFLAQTRLRLIQQKTSGNLTDNFEEGLGDAFARDARRIVEELFNDRGPPHSRRHPAAARGSRPLRPPCQRANPLRLYFPTAIRIPAIYHAVEHPGLPVKAL